MFHEEICIFLIYMCVYIYVCVYVCKQKHIK